MLREDLILSPAALMIASALVLTCSSSWEGTWVKLWTVIMENGWVQSMSASSFFLARDKMPTFLGTTWASLTTRSL